VDTLKLKKLYGRLKGIKAVVNSHSSPPFLPHEIMEDFNLIVMDISKIIGEDLESFLLKNVRMAAGKSVSSLDVSIKLLQILSYLEYGFNLSESIIEIGSIYKSIADEELKSRCSDILTAPGNFDRVINQATLVLEDRIRTKSQSDRTLVGVGLINKVLNSDLSNTILKVSDSADEHEGIGHICRGIIMSFRNPTHHYISDKFSREDALKFVAFVDNLLQIINNSVLASSPKIEKPG